MFSDSVGFVSKLFILRNALLAFSILHRISVSGFKYFVNKDPSYLNLSTCSIRLLYIVILVFIFGFFEITIVFVFLMPNASSSLVITLIRFCSPS